MIDNEAPTHEVEMEPTGIEAILADDQSALVAAQAPVQEAAPEAKPEAKPEAEQPFWYRKQLKKEKDRAAALERELEQARQQVPQQHLPDPRQDPIGHFETMRVMDRLERSEDRFVDKHGEQEFDAVKEWLTTRPDIEAWAIQQRHPWGSAFQQYQREKLSAEIGDDPNAWREAERNRLRAEIQAEFQASAPMAQPRIPAPASGQRSVAPSRTGPAFAGPTPIGDILKR